MTIIILTHWNLGDFCPAWVQGETITVRFYFDYSVTGAGFVISKVVGLKTTDIKARFPGQWYEKETEVRNSTTGALEYAGLHYNAFMISRSRALHHS